MGSRPGTANGAGPESADGLADLLDAYSRHRPRSRYNLHLLTPLLFPVPDWKTLGKSLPHNG